MACWPSTQLPFSQFLPHKKKSVRGISAFLSPQTIVQPLVTAHEIGNHFPPQTFDLCVLDKFKYWSSFLASSNADNHSWQVQMLIIILDKLKFLVFHANIVTHPKCSLSATLSIALLIFFKPSHLTGPNYDCLVLMWVIQCLYELASCYIWILTII